MLLLYIDDLNSVFNNVITIYFADDPHLNYARKKWSTSESVINYKLKKKITEWLLDPTGKSELVIFGSKKKN